MLLDPTTVQVLFADCFVVVRGEVYLVTDTDEVLLRAADTAVVQGVNHAWSNRTNEPALIVGTMMHAKPLPKEQYPAPGFDARPVKKTFRADDGLEIVGDVRGRGDTALVFLHGWGGDREYWKNQVGVFAADYRVVAIDQAGHSESAPSPYPLPHRGGEGRVRGGRKAWTADSLAGDVEAVVKALGLKRVILVGHSMAGGSRCWPPGGCQGRSSP